MWVVVLLGVLLIAGCSKDRNAQSSGRTNEVDIYLKCEGPCTLRAIENKETQDKTKNKNTTVDPSKMQGIAK